MHHGKKASKFKLPVRVAGELWGVESNLDGFAKALNIIGPYNYDLKLF